jgi:glycosyltransferase involved in cell wall biosynthesis
MKKIGIECESIENDTYGIARLINKLLEEIAHRPELEKEFKFYLYFKSRIPEYSYLNAPIFTKRVVGIPSFSLYYYVFLPIRQWFDGLDLMYYTNYMLPIIHLGKSLVFSAHDVFYESRSKNIPFHYRLAYMIFCNWAAVRATKLIAMSEFGMRELQKAANIGADRIIVNHLAADSARTDVQAHPGAYILFVAQAFPRRHLRETLLAFEKISPKFADLKFIAVGPDKYEPNIVKDLVHSINQRLGSEQVIYKVRVTDEALASLYKGARAVTYISDKEAFGLPPLEGLSYGAIPIVADNDLSRELFKSAAIYVKHPDSIDEIALAIERALGDIGLRQSIEQERHQILERFTWKAHTDRFLDIVRTLVHA